MVDELPTLGEIANRPKGKRGKKLKHRNQPLQLVGMDIGYGNGTSPGGVNYMLILVDAEIGHMWIYGLHGTTEEDVMTALWRFFLDAGRSPRTIQCNFDKRFLGKKVSRLLMSHGIKVKAVQPYWQSQNGLVESH